VTTEIKGTEQAVIEFLVLKGLTREEIALRLRNVYGSTAYCRASVFKWISEVRRDNEEL
jgi:hypothetical protein